MKVEQINQNLVRVANLGANATQVVTPNFTGATPIPKSMITDLLPHKRSIGVLEFLKKYIKGEKGGIIINAAGTGAVAPLFIAFNPLVKAKPDATPEEKKELQNTKYYTAWRQPVSAGLALLFQLGALTPIDHFLERLSNEKDTAKNFWLTLDQSAMQKKSYLERVIAKEMQKEGVKLSKAEFEKELGKRVSHRMAEQAEAVAENFAQTGKIVISGRTVEPKSMAEVLNMQIQSYIKDLDHQHISNDGIAFYMNRGEILMRNKDELRAILKKENLPSGTKELEEYLQKAIKDTDNVEVKMLLREIIDRHPAIRESRSSRTLARINILERMFNGNYDATEYMRKMQQGNAQIDELMQALREMKIETPKNATEQVIEQTLSKLKSLWNSGHSSLNSLIADGLRPNVTAEEITQKLSTDTVKFYNKLVDNKFKGFAQISKVLIGVFITLPISCTALNWVYPRFMDIFLPNLGGKKKQKAQVNNGGDK